nr:gamma-glutamyltransferase [FCB group bacterium]
VGTHGAVSSSSEYASQVGIDILKAGGNAVDAAVAVGFALAVTFPSAGNIGGGGFMIVRMADGTVTAFDYREKAPMAAHRDMFLDDSLNVIPGKSLETSWASGVPGSVDGMGKAHEKFGKLSWSDVVEPSIRLAKRGYQLDYQSVTSLNMYAEYLSRDPVTKRIFVDNDGEFKVGEKRVQKDLAKTLKRIARKGYREFYEGKTARYILECMQRTDGLITLNDLKSYHTAERTPIVFDYRGYNIITMPPASSGGVALAGILNQLENVDLGQLGFHSAAHMHYVIEAERRVFADRAHFLGDTDFIDLPLDALVSQSYADERWATIDSLSASNSEEISYGELPFIFNESDETTHYSVVDKWGNAVSVTTTINGWYGNGITVDHAGFLLNNEMDDFSSKPGVPNKFGLIGARANAIEPGKRMLSSMTPTIVESLDGELFLVVGSPGGSTIITTVAQVISNVIDFGMNLEAAVETPRFHHQWLPDYTGVEPHGFSSETLELLTSRGHKFYYRPNIGEANCIQYDAVNGLILGTGDSRRGGTALAY